MGAVEQLQTLGVGGIFVILVLREVLGFLRRRNGNGLPPCSSCAREVHDLWLWHNKEDTEGVKVWYVRKSLEDAIEKLAECIEHQNELLRTMNEELKKLEHAK